MALAPSVRARLPRLAERYGPRALVGLVGLALGVKTARAVLARVGAPGAALDDAYIHFQYARAIAEGHPFRFQAGEAVSTGGTSVLWPLALAPFWAAGLREERLVYAAWALSFAALAGLAVEAARLVRPLVGRPGAAAAAALVLGFSGFTWGAGSGMEIVPFAWAFAATFRRAADAAEGARAARALPVTADAARTSRRSLDALVLFAWATPLLRPEGSLASVAAAVAIAWGQRRVVGTRRALGMAALAGAGALGPTLVNLALTGRGTGDTADVKLLTRQPYGAWTTQAGENARLLVGTILDGEVWGAEYLPKGLGFVALVGLVAVGVRAEATRRPARGALVVALALSLFVPCLYATFLWNRLRYLLPFATGALLGVVCLAHVLGDLAARLAPRLAILRVGLAFGAAGVLAAKVDGVVDDLAASASGIDRQQATVGRWVKANLPEGARVGLNDTGAVAYFGERRTFDVVGLTTPGEGRYWKAGAASRFEHYERLAREGRALPTHFAVYPEWMAMAPVLGALRTEAVVSDATILGGAVLRVHDARWDGLDSGSALLALPLAPGGDARDGARPRVLDAFDVADLEDEAAHRYVPTGAREGEQVVLEVDDGAGRVVDGGRTNRTRDAFELALGGGEGAAVVVRVASAAPATLRLVDARDGAALASAEAPVTGTAAFVDVRLALPKGVGDGEASRRVVIESDLPVALFHVFAVAAPK